MGHGLKTKSGGIHVAFAAGTGVLCFVDLVASMIQDKLGVSMSSTDNKESIVSSGRNIIMGKRSIVGVGDSIATEEGALMRT